MSKYQAVYDLFTPPFRAVIDSRKVACGDIFFALRGENSDGNDYALKAIADGAAWAVVDRKELAAQSERCIVVDDTLQALQSLAAIHRRRLGLPVLALTGSNGKTTTKELVTAVLNRKFRTTATVGNLNNHIGVPLTLLSMNSATEFGVVEMGASSRGEIALLCSIASPDYGLITNIGRAHLGGFGGEEGIRRGKGELYDFLNSNNECAFVRSDDPVLAAMAAERTSMVCVDYTSRLADGLHSNLVGDYNRFNMAAAVAVGRYFGVDESDIAAAIAEYVPSNNRSQSIATERNLLTVDCYNANPSSMEAAMVNFCAECHDECPHRIMILGDMLELGEWSGAEHGRVVARALASDAERIVLVGANFAEIDASDPRIEHYADTESLCKVLTERPVANSFILIKGSRGIGLERTLPLL